MLLYLRDIHAVLLGLIVVVTSVGLSVAGVMLMHRYFSEAELRPNHEAGGLVFGAVALVYTVVLAFVVVEAWDGHATARRVSNEEANAISDVYRMSQGLPDSSESRIKTSITTYLRLVIDKEWSAMQEGQEDRTARLTIDGLWQELYNVHPANERESMWLTASIQALQQTHDSRRARIIATHPVVPPILWVFLIGGGLILLAFSYMFTSPIRWAQYYMIASFAAMIAGALFVIFEMHQPYTGDLKVEPIAFEHVYDHINNPSH
jgi:hypothetical protein